MKHPNHNVASVLIAFVLFLISAIVNAADILIDEGQQVAGLWVFPSASDANAYRYIPSSANVVNNEQGGPAFSMTFYVSDREEEVSENTSNSIVKADGGALLHFLMEYQTPPSQIEQAQLALKEVLGEERGENAFIAGPIVFDAGSYSIVSSSLTDPQAKTQVLNQESAPVLEGNRLALSSHLPPELATVFAESLNTITSDLSVVYELSFSGFSNAYRANMTIDWDKVSKSIRGGGGASIYFVSIDAQAEVEKMFQNGAIKLDVMGDDQDMEKLVEVAHAKALDILFSPVTPSQVPDEEQKELLEQLGDILKPNAESSPKIGFGINAGVKLKNIRTSGKTTLSFNKQATVHRNTTITANIGGLFKEYVNDERYIQTVSTNDAAFDLRKVFVKIDGELAQDIGGFVNSIEFTLNKVHPSGRNTTRQLLVHDQDLESTTVLGPLTYSNVERENSEDWLQYAYTASWSFEGGGSFVAENSAQKDAVVTLTSPYHRQQVFVEGDSDSLQSQGVRAVVVDLSYDFFGQQKSQRRMIRPSSGVLSIEPFELTQASNQDAYQYTITWILDSATRVSTSGQDNLGFLFINDLPSPVETQQNEATE